MSSVAQQESLVKASLFKFIDKHIPNADVSGFDDYVLTYVISILGEASRESCWDVEGFIEMMAAYIPELAQIKPEVVSDWVEELQAEMSQHADADSQSSNDDSGSDKISLTLQMVPPPVKNNRSHSNSESSEPETRRPMVEGDEHSDQCRVLHEMFPNSCAMEIKHCVSIAHGDVERAAATLLHRREHGQALSAAALLPTARATLCDDSELKNRIIARYSYVDKNSELKEHKPLAPKIEPKKMVRYRDNKIVSLKGERYTEVPKSGIDEEHLKKPKKQHCP